MKQMLVGVACLCQPQSTQKYSVSVSGYVKMYNLYVWVWLCDCGHKSILIRVICNSPCLFSVTLEACLMSLGFCFFIQSWMLRWAPHYHFNSLALLLCTFYVTSGEHAGMIRIFSMAPTMKYPVPRLWRLPLATTQEAAPRGSEATWENR